MNGRGVFFNLSWAPRGYPTNLPCWSRKWPGLPSENQDTDREARCPHRPLGGKGAFLCCRNRVLAPQTGRFPGFGL